jgi:hypothetical protein
MAEQINERCGSIVGPHTRVPDQPRSEGIADASQGFTHSSPCGRTDFVDHSVLNSCGAPSFLRLCRAGRSLRQNIMTMNGAVRGRRLASPVRLTLAMRLGDDLDGAWWPHTASVASELPELMDALCTRLGQIVDIKVNWSSLEGSPDLDALNRVGAMDSGRVIGHQRLMTVTGSQTRANLLVVPSRTSSALAVMVLRHAAALPVMPLERDTQAFRTADVIVRAARAESALCARRCEQLDPPTCRS